MPLTVGQIIAATGGTLVGTPPPITVDGVAIDSRENLHNKLFIPIKGARYDGHDFIQQAFANGAALCLSERDTPHEHCVIQVADTTKALQQLAKAYKNMLQVQTIAITGSVGKTTTKDMVAAVLSQSFHVLKTPGNFNNDIGLPLTIFQLERHHQFAVLEMGMNHFGEIALLSDIAQPDLCVITNIGVSHIEHLGSQQGILAAKSEIFTHMNPKGTILINGDDPLLLTLQTTYPQAQTYGIQAHNHVYAHHIVPQGIHAVDFTIQSGETLVPVTIPYGGNHMVQNALAAFAVGLWAGIDTAAIQQGLAQVSLTKMRMDISTTPSGITIMDDTYNASPQSMEAAIAILTQATGRRVAILGDMFELGAFTEDMHTHVGSIAAQSGIEVLIFVGIHSKFAYDQAIALNHDNVTHFAELPPLLEMLAGNHTPLKEGDTVLVKASRGMALETIVKQLKAV